MILPQEIENIRSQVKEKIAESGADLLEIQYRRMAPHRSVISFIVDKEGGIKLDECAQINLRLSDFFDELSSKMKEGIGATSWIHGSYTLEVSSPGLDRPLVTEQDFARTLGQTLRILHRQSSGAVITRIGKIRSIKEGVLDFELEGQGGALMELPLSTLVRAVREIRFTK